MAMTQVVVDSRRFTDGAEPQSAGGVFFSPWAPVVGDGRIANAAPFRVPYEGSAVTVALAEVPVGNAWRVRLEVDGQVVERLVRPSGAGPVNLADLPVLDPKTLSPGADLEPAWWAVANGLQQAHDEAVQAAGGAAASEQGAASSATAAAESEQGAAASVSTAAGSAAAAAGSAAASEGARVDAVAARQGSEAARTGAEQARTEAQAARDLSLAGQFAGSPLTNVSLNTIVTPGVYRAVDQANSTLANDYPIANMLGFVEVLGHVGNISQRVTIQGGATGFMRTSVSRRRTAAGVWDAWRFTPAQRIDKTAGLAIYTWDEQAAREQLFYGDTGWRDISGLLVNGWAAASLSLRRTTYDVEVRVTGLSPAAATGSTAFTLPTGFAGWNGVADARAVVWVSGTKSWLAAMGSTVQIAGWSAADGPSHFTAKFTTGLSWPTSLPGTPLGTVPNL